MRTGKLPLYLVFVCLGIAANSAQAGACTYSEAMMAFKQGNIVRGQALMRMAANDGDLRAEQYLAAIQNIGPSNRINSEKPDILLADVEKIRLQSQ